MFDPVNTKSLAKHGKAFWQNQILCSWQAILQRALENVILS